MPRKSARQRPIRTPLPHDPKGLAQRPEAANLIGIYAALSDASVEAVLRDFGGRQFADFKRALIDVAVARSAPLGGEMKRLMADPVHVDRVLADGAARAAAIAGPVIAEVKKILGFVRSRGV